MLVYENYNKFISATDTIRKMKNNVESMEDKMDSLGKNMEAISECTTEITNSLAARRSQIERLVGVNKMLKKIQFIVELPQTLRKCIEMKTYAAAVNYYNMGNAILTKYSHIKSFQHIQEESNKVVGGLKIELRKQVRQPLSNPTSLAEVRTAAEMLRALHPDDQSVVEELRDLLVTPTQDKLEKDVQVFYKSLEEQSAAQCGEDAALQLPAGQIFTPPLKFAQLWLRLAEIASTFSVEMKSALSILEESIDAKRRKRLGEVAKETFSKCVTALSAQTTSHLQHCLGVYTVQRFEHLKNNPEFVGEEQPAPPIDSEAAKTVTALKPLYKASYEAADTLLASWKGLCASLHRLLPEISVPADHSHYIKFMSVCCDRLLKEILTWLTQFCQPATLSDAKRNQKARTLLCAAVGVQRTLQVGLAEFGKPIDHNHKVNVADHTTKFEAVLKLLLSSYTKLEGQTLSSLVRTGIDRSNWLYKPESSEVSAMPKELTRNLEDIESIIMDTLENGKEGKASLPADTSELASLPTRFGKGRKTGSEVNMLNRSNVFNSVTTKPKKLERLALMDSIVIYSLKTFLECIRTHTLGYNGFNQLHLDATYIGKSWYTFASKPKSLGEALDEIVSSAHERCVQSKPSA
eukprot:TRINITY_DN55969_c0_g1_i1.p1 TRINITY_DN55969_c0_g1~~TRINITY_DN55969_c0_g1_i1.p1  ORF type:complete len:728 (-),score=72.07 TRINITY_DN55969_c0_g1_i1:78-1982(-)